MTNKKNLLGIWVITLVFGMTIMGCVSAPSDSNPYIGDWSGTFKPSGGQEVEATISFTDTAWTLTAGTLTLNGSYTRGTIQATLSLGNYTVASASALLTKLTVTFNNGEYNGSSGSFTTTTAKLNTDPFKGAWSGTFKPSGGQEVKATITFTDTAWTLTAGTISLNGTYTKSKIGYTATLTQAQYNIGTGLVNPISEALTLTITNGTNSGSSGSFTRAQ
jgi:hypothetical protein